MFCGTNDGKHWSFYEDAYTCLEEIEISTDEYNALIEGQNDGKVIIFEHGKKPFLRTPFTAEENETLFSMHQYLYDTDYIVTKIAEGIASLSDYPVVLKARQKARDTITKILLGN